MHSEQYSLLVLLYTIIHFTLPSFFFNLNILLVCCVHVHCFSLHHNTINAHGFKMIFDSVIRVCNNYSINNSTLLPAWITCASPL